MRTGRLMGIAVLGMATFLFGTPFDEEVLAQGKAGTLELLLKATDFEKIGLKGVDLAPPEAYDRTEQLGFERTSDSMMVMTLAKLDTTGSPGTLRSTLELIAKDVVPVSGVGDEAYSFLGGLAFTFRKGNATFQMMSGLDIASGAKPFLTKDQLATMAKAVCSRL